VRWGVGRDTLPAGRRGLSRGPSPLLGKQLNFSLKMACFGAF